MTTPELNLVEAMRAELAAIDPPRRCCRQAETAGLAGALRPRRRATARLVLRLRRRRETQGVAGPTAAGSPGVAGPVATGSPAAAPTAAFDWDTAQEHCRAAYLRGRFLAHGSLSLASGRTHLEFVVGADEAAALCEHLGQFGLHASWRLRRGRGVVTWKSAETMGTFLRLVGGAAALLELEARQVSRSVRGDLNRGLCAPARGDRGSRGRRSSRCPAIRGPSRCAGPPRHPRGELHGVGRAVGAPPFRRATSAGPDREACSSCRRRGGGAPPDALAGVTN